MESDEHHDGLDAARALLIAAAVVCALLGVAVVVDVLARPRPAPARAARLVDLLGLAQLSVVGAGSPLRHPELGNAGVALRPASAVGSAATSPGALLLQPVRTGDGS